MLVIPKEVMSEVRERSGGRSEVSHCTGEKLVMLQLIRGKSSDLMNRCNLMEVTEYEVLGFYLRFMDAPARIGRKKDELIKAINSLTTKIIKMNFLENNLSVYDKKLQAAVDAWGEYFKDFDLPTVSQLHDVTVDSRLRRPRGEFLTNQRGLRR